MDSEPSEILSELRANGLWYCVTGFTAQSNSPEEHVPILTFLTVFPCWPIGSLATTIKSASFFSLTAGGCPPCVVGTCLTPAPKLKRGFRLTSSNSKLPCASAFVFLNSEILQVFPEQAAASSWSMNSLSSGGSNEASKETSAGWFIISFVTTATNETSALGSVFPRTFILLATFSKKIVFS